jgi:hypothetical protein
MFNGDDAPSKIRVRFANDGASALAAAAAAAAAAAQQTKNGNDNDDNKNRSTKSNIKPRFKPPKRRLTSIDDCVQLQATVLQRPKLNDAALAHLQRFTPDLAYRSTLVRHLASVALDSPLTNLLRRHVESVPDCGAFLSSSLLD